jgi:hypothetical protein
LYENLKASMLSLGYTRNEMDVCAFNKTNRKGVQCSVCVHVDDLDMYMSMILDLTQGLTKRYGEISQKHGPVINYLDMVLTTFKHAGQVTVTMSGYTDDVLKSS